MDGSINLRSNEPQSSSDLTPAPKSSGLYSIFYGPNGLRAGWRLLIFIFVVVALRFLAITIIRFIAGPPSGAALAPTTIVYPGAVARQDAILFTIILIASLIMGLIEHRRLAHYGLDWQKPFPKNFWVGLLWGFLSITGIVFAMVLLHVCRITGIETHGAPLASASLEWAGAFLLVGFFEEFTFRGYMQFTLTSGIGFWPAALLLSCLFLAAHIGNSGESVFGLIQIAAFGIFICIALQRTGNLWWPIGFHAGVDWTQTFFYGVPDSGLNAGRNFLHSEFHGPTWLTGGSTGPEGSVLTLTALVILSVLMIRLYPQVRYPDTEALGLRNRFR